MLWTNGTGDPVSFDQTSEVHKAERRVKPDLSRSYKSTDVSWYSGTPVTSSNVPVVHLVSLLNKNNSFLTRRLFRGAILSSLQSEVLKAELFQLHGFKESLQL